MSTGPSAVSHCCYGVIRSRTIHMEISTPKTKVMVLGDPAPPLFICNGHPIERVQSLCYLGLYFHESVSVAHLIKPLKAKTAGSWAMVQQKHAQFQCEDTVNLKLRLFQAILVPTVHYGCAVWGMHSPSVALTNSAHSELQRVYERYLRIICGLQPSTPPAFLFAELNVLHLKVCWWRQSLKFWNKLARLLMGHKTILLDNLQDSVRFRVRNFSRSVTLYRLCWA